MTRLVRTTMQPHLEVEVSDAEALDLARQGVLVTDGSPSGPTTVPQPAPGPAATRPARPAATKED